MIETLFVVNTSNSKTKDLTRRYVLPSPNQENSVLDPKKAQNIAIALRALNVTIEEVCEALSEGNFSFFVFYLIIDFLYFTSIMDLLDSLSSMNKVYIILHCLCMVQSRSCFSQYCYWHAIRNAGTIIKCLLRLVYTIN